MVTIGQRDVSSSFAASLIVSLRTLVTQALLNTLMAHSLVTISTGSFRAYPVY